MDFYRPLVLDKWLRKKFDHPCVMNKCQLVWKEQTGNKLHELKPDFNSKCSFLGYSRQIQTKITRCRIGHTRLTHTYLLTNEQPPFCISCNEPFTVKHFLITCTEFNYIRNRYFTAKTVKELFTDTSSDKIINFLKETNLFNKLLCFNGHTNRVTDSINLDFLRSFSKLAHYVKWYFYSRLDAICPIEVERL